MVGLPTSATASIAACMRRAAIAHCPVARDVLDHHDRVVDQDADGEDQREQADAVERVAHQPRRKEREQDGGRDHHAPRPASRQPMAAATRTTIETVARPRWNSSSLAFSLAVSP